MHLSQVLIKKKCYGKKCLKSLNEQKLNLLALGLFGIWIYTDKFHVKIYKWNPVKLKRGQWGKFS